MCCFNVQKEIQRCADCFTCSWFACGNNHFQVLFAFFFFFFPLEEEKSASEKGETEMLVLAVRPPHRPLSEWFSNLFLCLGWNSLEDIGPSCGCLCKTKSQTTKQEKNLTKVEHCTIFFSFVLFCLFVLCLLLPPLLICLGCSVCPCHLLSLALHPSSAVSGGELFYSLPSARLTPHLLCLPLGSNPTCFPNAV